MRNFDNKQSLTFEYASLRVTMSRAHECWLSRLSTAILNIIFRSFCRNRGAFTNYKFTQLKNESLR